MYTLIMTDNNEIITTIKEKIVKQSNYVDKIQILTAKDYKGIDMTDATVWMRFVLPVSKKIQMTRLALNDENYRGEGYLQYTIPANTLFTSEAGQIEISLTFIKLEENETTGEQTAYTRKTWNQGYIDIKPIAIWEDFIPDELLNEVDQRLLALEAREKDLSALSEELYKSRVIDIALNKNEESKDKIILIDQSGNFVGEGIEIEDISESVVKKIVGEDLDGVQDGIIHLDKIEGNLDDVISSTFTNEEINVIGLDELIASLEK